MPPAWNHPCRNKSWNGVGGNKESPAKSHPMWDPCCGAPTKLNLFLLTSIFQSSSIGSLKELKCANHVARLRTICCSKSSVVFLSWPLTICSSWSSFFKKFTICYQTGFVGIFLEAWHLIFSKTHFKIMGLPCVKEDTQWGVAPAHRLARELQLCVTSQANSIVILDPARLWATMVVEWLMINLVGLLTKPNVTFWSETTSQWMWSWSFGFGKCVFSPKPFVWELSTSS